MEKHYLSGGKIRYDPLEVKKNDEKRRRGPVGKVRNGRRGIKKGKKNAFKRVGETLLTEICNTLLPVICNFSLIFIYCVFGDLFLPAIFSFFTSSIALKKCFSTGDG